MADNLSQAEHDKIFNEKILPQYLDHIQPAKKPTLFMLGGQPGAGKSKVRDAIRSTPEGKGSLVIDPDELRTYHPRYLEHVANNPDTAASEVHVDAIAWAGELQAAALQKKVNIIYDGTLGNPVTATKMARDAAASGHKVEVHVVAVSLEVSEQGVRGRYEKAFKAYEENPEESAPPRNVPDNIQKMAFDGIPATLNELCKLEVVSRLRVATRDGETKSNAVAKKGAISKNAAVEALKALNDERNRARTDEEEAEYFVTAKEIEGLMEERLGDPHPELDEVRQKHVRRVDANALRRVQDRWILRNYTITIATT